MPSETLRAAEIEALDERYLATCMKVRFYPIVVRRQEGTQVWDDQGRAYLDFTSGWSVAATGYGHPKVVEAVTRQFRDTSFAGSISMLNEPSVRLGECLAGLVPGRFDKKVWYGLSGSDACETLGKMVPLATGRPKMISFIGGYHGMTGTSAALTGHRTTARLPASGNVIKIPYPDPYRPVFGVSPDALAPAILDYLEHYLFETVVPPELVGGIIVEAVQADSGDIVPPPGFLTGLQAICRRHGILLLLDEVKVGLGRTGRWWGFEHDSDVEPDLVAIGKALGGGMPLSAVVGRSDILDAGTANNMYSLAGNAVACAAGLATLQVIEEEGLVNHAGEVGAYLLESLAQLEAYHPSIGHVRGRGCILGLELVRDRTSKEPAPLEAAKLVYRCYENGLLLFYGGLYSNVIEFTPPFTITRADVDQGVDIIDRSLADVEAGRVPDERLGSFLGW
ncbi:MAG: aspartate aminotransferase family protein [Chloroflexi bacterium]|nr:aspartate aminotransferase family protein [Chloroflexota bacterium]